MSKLTIQPMQWTRTKDLHDCAPLAEDDLKCMEEVRSVLAKHNKLGRFALHLIHKHFDLDDDEILVEYSDPTIREQFFKVEKANSEAVARAIPTTWTLEALQPSARCVCAYRPGQGHLGRHENGITMQGAAEGVVT